MITVRGKEFDFDLGRTKDTRRLEEAKPSINQALEELQKPENRDVENIALVCVKAVKDILGEDAPATLGMDVEYWKECILIFADAMTAVTAEQKGINDELTKYKADRLGF